MGTSLDLSSLFGAALQAMTANRQEINALDGHNGNHGDNMVENLRLITSALRSRRSQPPAKALEYASQRLEKQGRGGSSQYYAQGLKQAAQQLQGRSQLGNEDVTTLVQALLGALPNEGYPQQPQAGGTVLDQLLGGLVQQQQPAQPQAAGLLEQLLGGGVQQPAQPQPQAQAGGVDAADVLSVLLPAGMAFLQAKQAGADTTAAAGQALMSVLAGGQVNPLQTGSPRAAAGSLIAQSILQAVMGRR
jgi:hypothetical protein